jgi:small subunit ribosomal protein S4
MKLFLKGERCFGPKCAVERRRYVPGEHGQARRKTTEFGVQLAEKQKVRSIYGVLERQFRKHFEEAERRPGMTGSNLLAILERRMDNVVFRLGFASSRSGARQLVRHGHFSLNGRKTNIPSAMVHEGDVLAVRDSSRDNEYFQIARQGLTGKTLPRWLTLDVDALAGHVSRLPLRDDIDTAVNEQLVVEYYSR